MWATDLGHIYDRKYRQTFTSRVFAWEQAAISGALKAQAELGPGRKLSFQVRSAVNEEALKKQDWHAVEGEAFALGATDRCLQYRAVFQSDNGDRYPVLDRVSITLAR